MSRSVLTIATGKQVYWDMATTLAVSFEIKNPDSDILFNILTDLPNELPPFLKRTTAIRMSPGAIGTGFSSKLLLDRFAPSDQTLFIDADCLCLGSLEPVFAKFAGRSVSVVGGEIAKGEWFGDVAAICQRAGVRALPKFNGGVYYLERGPKAVSVYDRARDLEPEYDQWGLVRLRGAPNDELLMAIAMAQFGCGAIPEDGTIMGDFLSTSEVVALDVLSGRCVLRNPKLPNPRHNPESLVSESRPAVVHFLGHHVFGLLYRREVLKLRLFTELGLPTWAAHAAAMAYATPFEVLEVAKDFLRPGYHQLWGPRQIKARQR